MSVNKYAFGKIYQITDNNTGQFYLGSTTKDVDYIKKHVLNIVKEPEAKELFKQGNYTVEILEEKYCFKQCQLDRRLREWMNNLNSCINKSKEKDSNVKMVKCIVCNREYNDTYYYKTHIYQKTHRERMMEP